MMRSAFLHVALSLALGALGGCVATGGVSSNGPGASASSGSAEFRIEIPARPASFARRPCGCPTACADCSAVCEPGSCRCLACEVASSSATITQCEDVWCPRKKPHARHVGRGEPAPAWLRALVVPPGAPEEVEALAPGEHLDVRGHIYRRHADGTITVEERSR